MSSNGDELQDLRKQIDALDEKILGLMAQRVTKVRAVGHYKHDHGLPLLDEQRWKTLIKSRVALGKKLDLAPDFVAAIYELIHKYALLVEAQDDDQS